MAEQLFQFGDLSTADIRLKLISTDCRWFEQALRILNVSNGLTTIPIWRRQKDETAGREYGVMFLLLHFKSSQVILIL